MKVKFIYWEASWNLAQQMYGEKYPHYGLLLHDEDDTCTVLFFTQEKQMVFETISRKETDFVELAEVEIPEEIYDSAVTYLSSRRKLQEFSGTFLSYVEQHREAVEKAGDALEGAVGTEESQAQRRLGRMLGDDIDQPFPRRPKKTKAT